MNTELLAHTSIRSVTDTSKDDLRDYVLAENVQVGHARERIIEIAFDFLCPNCGKRHWAREIVIEDGKPLFATVWWSLRCGGVGVRMPWAQSPARDRKSVYDQIDWSGGAAR